jgi:hypothetical protein
VCPTVLENMPNLKLRSRVDHLDDMNSDDMILFVFLYPKNM